MFDVAFVDAKMNAHKQYSVFDKKGLSIIKSDGTKIFTGMLFGTLRTVIALHKDYNPRRIVFVYEGENNRREVISPDYKAHRKNRKPLPGFEKQYQMTIGALSLLGLTQIKADEFEADDLIATLVSRSKGKDNLIVSSDKDLFTLLEEKTCMLLHTPKKMLFTERHFKEKFEINPNQFSLYLALVGDGTDNITGINRIDPETAKTLIQKHDTWQEIFKTLDEQSKGRLLINLKLTRLNCNIEISQTLQLHKEKTTEKFWNLMEELKFRSMFIEQNRQILEEIHERNEGYQGN